MKAHRPPKAFTLVELLVVIGIIALLISILMPALSKAKDQANKTRCLNNLRQISMAVQLYANDTGYLPGEHGVTTDTTSLPYPQEPVSQGSLFKAGCLKNKDVWICPADRRVPGMFSYSYTMNGRLGVRPGSDHISGTANPPTISGGFFISPRKINTVRHWAKVIVFGEENTGGTTGYLINDPRFTNQDVSEPRHRGLSCVGYLDGHADTIPGDICLYRNDKYLFTR